MPRPWRVAFSLQRLKEQINERWPNRSKVSDGTIGNAEHASRASDHNPYLRVDGMGVVTAFDITHDPLNGPDGAVLAESLITDIRVKYLIFNRRIWKARTGQWHPYTGPNPHNHHVHVSVKSEVGFFDNRSNWPLPL